MKGFALSLAILFGVIWIVATFNGCQQSASAHPFGSGGSWGAEKKIDFAKYVISYELDLDDHQKAELDHIAADLNDQHAAMRSAAQEFRAGLLNELEKDQVAAENLKSLFQKFQPAITAVGDIMAEKMAAFHALLTPDQRAAVLTRLESHDSGGGCRFGRRFSRSGDAPISEKKLDIIKFMISKELGLSDLQEAELDRITADLRIQHDTMRTNAQTFKTGLIDELAKDQVVAEDLKQLFQTHAPVVETMADTMAEKVAAFHTVLTPEQRTALLDKLKSHGQGHRFGHRW